MNAIQQTVRIDPGRRALWLDEPLPETVPCGTARVEITFISPPPPESPRVSANAAAWREFLDALDKIDDEPLGDMPPRCTVRRELPL